MARDIGGGDWGGSDTADSVDTRESASSDNDSWSRNYQAMGDANAKWSSQRPTVEGAGWGWKDLGGGVTGAAKKLAGYVRDYQAWEKSAPYGSRAPSRAGGFGRGYDNRSDNRSGSDGYAQSGAVAYSKEKKKATKKVPAPVVPVVPSYYTDPITGRVVYSSRLTGGTGNDSYSNQRILDALMGTSTATSNLAQDIAATEAWIAEVQKAGGDASPYLSELNRMKELQMRQGTPVSSPLLDYVNSGMRERVQNEQIDTSMRNSLLASEEAAARRGMSSLGNPMADAVRSQLGLQGQQAKNSAALASQQQAMSDRLNLMNFLKSAEGQTASQNMQRTQIPMTFAEWQERQKEAATDWANRFKMSDEDWDRQKKAMKMSQQALREQQRQQEEDSGGFDWGGLAGSVIGSFF